jgi:thioredoxin reductase
MLRKSYDVAIVGGGPVGVSAALKASSLRKTAILIDATPPKQFQFT